MVLKVKYVHFNCIYINTLNYLLKTGSAAIPYILIYRRYRYKHMKDQKTI